MAKNVSKWRVLWDEISEDRDLVFFILSWLLAWVMPGAFLLARVIGSVGLFLVGVAFYFLRHKRVAEQLSRTKHVPVVCVVGKPDDEARRTFELALEAIRDTAGFRAFTSVERFFNVQYRETLRHQESPFPPGDPQSWHDFIHQVQERIGRFVDRLPGTKVFHVFIQGPASLALGLGAVFACKHPLIVYQWAGTGYKPVLDLRENPRRVTDPVTGELRFLSIPEDAFMGLGEDTAVALGLASHSLEGSVRSFLQERGNGQWKVIVVKSTYGGTLKEDDWAPVVQELFSVFCMLHDRQEVRRIHLFHSMPVALAFGLGMALGDVLPITVYNWTKDQATYHPVMKLNELKSLL